jgi:hypothetical protein
MKSTWIIGRAQVRSILRVTGRIFSILGAKNMEDSVEKEEPRIKTAHENAEASSKFAPNAARWSQVTSTSQL